MSGFLFFSLSAHKNARSCLVATLGTIWRRCLRAINTHAQETRACGRSGADVPFCPRHDGDGNDNKKDCLFSVAYGRRRVACLARCAIPVGTACTRNESALAVGTVLAQSAGGAVATVGNGHASRGGGAAGARLHTVGTKGAVLRRRAGKGRCLTRAVDAHLCRGTLGPTRAESGRVGLATLLPIKHA